MADILVVEDNPDYRELLQNFLEDAGYAVTAAKDGAEALRLAKAQPFDLVLLDIMLPGMDGYDVCKRLRRESDVPVVMLTALSGELHQMRGFDVLVDEYIAKPVSMPLLLRKVAAVLRRAAPAAAEVFTYGDVTMDVKRHVVTARGAAVELTRLEFEILRTLLASRGEVVSRDALLTALWGEDYFGDDRIVDTHIKNIRRKLGADAYIETVRGVGYRVQA